MSFRLGRGILERPAVFFAVSRRLSFPFARANGPSRLQPRYTTYRNATKRGISASGVVLRSLAEAIRWAKSFAMESEDFCDSPLVTEVCTPAGHWSSYPSHRHDEDDFPRITYLEETYYHRLNPRDGFGIQRVYTDDARSPLVCAGPSQIGG